MLPYSFLSYPILFYFILSYFILSYLILAYLIHHLRLSHMIRSIMYLPHPRGPNSIQQLRCGVCRPGGSLGWSLGSDRGLLPPPCGEAWGPTAGIWGSLKYLKSLNVIGVACGVTVGVTVISQCRPERNSMEFRGGERENDSWGKAPKVTSLAAQVTRCDEMHFSSSPSPPHFYEHFFFWGGLGGYHGISQNWCGQREANQSIVLLTCVPLHTVSSFGQLVCHAEVQLDKARTWKELASSI